MAVDREFYVYRFGRPRPGRTDGRADGGGRKTDGRTDGRRTGGRRADGRADRRKGGRTGGRTDHGCQRPGGRAAGPILNDSTTIFIDFHKKHPKKVCFSVVSRPAEAQVPIFTGQMKKASKKCQKNTVFFAFFKSGERASTDFYCSKFNF